MPAAILLRNIGGTDDKKLVLSNNQAGRLISIGTDWQSIRLGFRLCANPQGNTSALSGNPVLAVGVCSGVTNMYGDATCAHFVGAIERNFSWTYNAGVAPYYSSTGSTAFGGGKRVGTTNTYTSATTTHGLSANTSIRHGLFVEIFKGANFNISIGRQNGTGADLSLADFKTIMELSSGTTYPNPYTVTGVGSVAVNEAVDGYLNAIYFYWNRTVPNLEISDAAYTRLN